MTFVVNGVILVVVLVRLRLEHWKCEVGHRCFRHSGWRDDKGHFSTKSGKVDTAKCSNSEKEKKKLARDVGNFLSFILHQQTTN